MYKSANVHYAKKLYGESAVVRALDYIENKKTPKSIEIKTEVFKIKKLLDAMEKYDNAWWLSKDSNILVKNQLNETSIIVPAKRLIPAVNEVFGTDFHTISELVAKLPQLKKMAAQITV